eukprot:gnl/TRDRNA2_/TRDRNA2_126972_c0_seq1.p1 gnl/TRDRNA2_/TRDRNA2_126972_c0~~gnl/TRDRNA2_/TRDRNA2_126972_c0_seq1.p1  ORF type:complete len:269 (+),score=36.88 gnl/TRDRNA2_/TRDRNA2_126972_c0_seq1:48-809(+)
MQPAERCCGSCTLLQGVQIIASYDVVNGAVHVLWLLTGRSETVAGRSDIAIVVDSVQTFVHAMALLAGLKGLVGAVLRDARRVRMLFVYHVVELIVGCIAIIFRDAEACREIARLQRLHRKNNYWQGMDCSSIRGLLFMEFGIHLLLFSYLSYIVWSLAERLQSSGGAGDLGRPPLLGDHELAERGFGGDGLPPWFLGASGGLDGDMQQQQRAPLNLHGQTGSAPPFSGQPRNLADASIQGPTPFSGTPHRLE